MKFLIHWSRINRFSVNAYPADCGNHYCYMDGDFLWVSWIIFEIRLPIGWMPDDVRSTFEHLDERDERLWSKEEAKHTLAVRERSV